VTVGAANSRSTRDLDQRHDATRDVNQENLYGKAARMYPGHSFERQCEIVNGWYRDRDEENRQARDAADREYRNQVDGRLIWLVVLGLLIPLLCLGLSLGGTLLAGMLRKRLRGR